MPRTRWLALEHVARVVERLRAAQARPGRGVEEAGRVGRLLDEVRVDAGAGSTAAAMASSASVSGPIEIVSMQIRPGSVARAPAPGVWRASAPPMWRSCTSATGEPGTAIRASSSIAARGQVVDQRVRAAVGERVARIHRQVAERGRRLHRERVQLRAERAQRRQQLAPRRLGAQERRVDDRERAPAHGLGELRQRREVDDVRPRGDLLGQAVQQRGPRAQDLGGPLEAEEQRARVQLAHGHDRELERGHDPEVPAAAAQRPEQLGLVLGVGAHEVAVGGDELDRGHRVGLQAVLAGQPADPAAERVADDADVRRGAVQAREPELRQPRRHVLPARRRADAHAPRRRRRS